MNILISGANGYLGSNVFQHLANNNTVLVLDRDYGINSAIVKFDCFFYFSNPNEIAFNTDGEKAFIEMKKHFTSIKSVLENNNIAHVVYSSTLRVYDNPVNEYAKSHLVIEKLLRKYTQENSIELTIARFGNTFGGSTESMVKRHSLVPHCFIKNALELKTIKMLSDGSQYRDFVPMSLVNKYMDFILETKPLLVDICSGINIQINEVLSIILQEIPSVEVERVSKVLEHDCLKLNSVFNISKNEIVKEIISTIHRWRKVYE